VVRPVDAPVLWVTSLTFVLSSPLPVLPPAVSPLPSELFSPGSLLVLFADTVVAPPELEPWRAGELILYSSRLSRSGAIYEVMRALVLA